MSYVRYSMTTSNPNAYAIWRKLAEHYDTNKINKRNGILSVSSDKKIRRQACDREKELKPEA